LTTKTPRGTPEKGPHEIPASEAKEHFAEYVHAAEVGESVLITRYGKPVAALVSAQALESLERFEAAVSGGGLAGLAGLWNDAEELTTELDRTVAARGNPRPVPELG
jgi:prevent-host-death family protein